MADEIDDLVSNDTKKARNAIRNYRSEGRSFSVPQFIESVAWTMAGFTVLAMVASLPWVGNDQPIAGRAWLGLSLISILLFGGAAFAIRFVRTQVDTGEVDRAIESGFSRR